MVWFHDPFTLFHDLQREFGRLGTRRTLEQQPRMNVAADAEALTLVAELPGFGPADVEVRVEQDLLVLEGFKTRTAPAAETHAESEAVAVPEAAAATEPVRERRFRRALRLPFRVDAEDVTAELKHGLLTVRAPRRAADRPRVVPVQIS